MTEIFFSLLALWACASLGRIAGDLDRIEEYLRRLANKADPR